MAVPENLQHRLRKLREHQRPRLLSPIAVYECVLGLEGFLIPFFENKEDFAFYFTASTMGQVFWYFLVWQFWKGRNWARIVMLILCALGPIGFFTAPMHHIMIACFDISGGLSGLFLLYWLNTSEVRNYFRREDSLE